MAGLENCLSSMRFLFPCLCRPSMAGRSSSQDGQYWEVTTWLPGAPPLESPPAPARVESVFAALALIHRRLSCNGQTRSKSWPSPAASARLERLADIGLDLMVAALERAG